MSVNKINKFINFESICRLCMIQAKSMIQLFNNNYNLPNKIMVLIPTLKIHTSDNLPMQICQQCVDQIKNFDNFKLQCENSYLTLNKYLHTQQMDNKSSEECVDRSPLQIIMSDSSISDELADENRELENNFMKEELNGDRTYPEVKEENNTEEYKYEVILSEPDVKFSVLDESHLTDNAVTAKLCTNKTSEPSKKISVSCHICGKLMAKKRFNEHVRNHSAGRPFKCEECGKAFALKDSFKKHSLVHSGVEVHMCDICGKRFKRLSALKLHLVTHTGQKSHVCDICGKGFTQLGSFRSHKLLHLGVKPFNCDICGNSYSQKNTLQIHLAVHAGERQHVCKICGKGFLLKGHLQNHMVVHSGEKKFSCEVCGVSYTQRHNLKNHKKTTGHQSN